jgi:hypothetical protein
MLNPMQELEAVEEEMRAVAPGFPFDASTIQKWADTLRSIRERVGPFLEAAIRVCAFSDGNVSPGLSLAATKNGYPIEPLLLAAYRALIARLEGK